MNAQHVRVVIFIGKWVRKMRCKLVSVWLLGAMFTFALALTLFLVRSLDVVINSKHLNQYLLVMSGFPVVVSTNHK